MYWISVRFDVNIFDPSLSICFYFSYDRLQCIPLLLLGKSFIQFVLLFLTALILMNCSSTYFALCFHSLNPTQGATAYRSYPICFLILSKIFYCCCDFWGMARYSDTRMYSLCTERNEYLVNL